MVCLYTLNGTLLLERPVCEQSDDNVLSCAFYEGVGNEWLERELFFTGHRKGLVNVSDRFGAHFLPYFADLATNCG